MGLYIIFDGKQYLSLWFFQNLYQQEPELTVAVYFIIYVIAAGLSLFGRFKKFKVDYSVIPWNTFTDPEVAHVGLSERDAIEKGIEYEITKYGIEDLDRAIADNNADGFVKVLTVPSKDKILGAAIVGYHAGELLTELVTAMKQGLGLKKILGTIHSYLTISEANKFVAGNWSRAHAPQGVLKWVEKYHAWQRK